MSTPLTFGYYHDHHTQAPAKMISVLELAEMAAEPRIGSKGSAPVFAPHDGQGKTKATAELAKFALLIIDHDNDNKTRDEIKAVYDFFNVQYLAFTTSSHTKADQRWKVVIPLAGAVDAATFERISKGVARSFNTDPAQARVQQIAYVPNKVANDALYDCINELSSDRKLLDTSDLEHALMIEALTGWDELQKLKAEQNAKQSAAPIKLRTVTGDHAGIIGKIADAYSHDLRGVLEGKGYIKRGSDYLAPNSSSGIAGVRILMRDGKEVAYSHHSAASDPLSADNHNGHALDIVDVICELNHGGDFSAMIKQYAEDLDPEGQKQRQRDHMAEKAAVEAAAKLSGIEEALGADQAGSEKKATLKSVDLHDVMNAELDEVSFSIDPIFPKRHVTLFGGHGGMGKSMLALTMAAHVAAGAWFAGLPVEQSKVLFVSLEDEASVVKVRLRNIIRHYNLNKDDVLSNLALLDGTGGEAALMTQSTEFNSKPEMTKTFTELAHKSEGAGLIIIDNASDAYDGSENVRKEVRFFIRWLARMARHRGASVVLLAHIDKAAQRNGTAGDDYSGSTAWHNSVRSRIALKHDPNHSSTSDDPVPLVLEHQKANLSARAKTMLFEFIDGGLIVPIDGDISGSDIDRATWDAVEMVRCIKLAIEQYEIIVPTRHTAGNGSVMQAIEVIKEYPSNFKGSQGRKRASAAILEAKSRGWIKEESYRDHNKNDKRRFVVSSTYENLIDLTA